MEIHAVEESYISLYKDGELVGVVKANGSVKHYSVEEATNKSIKELYELNTIKI